MNEKLDHEESNHGQQLHRQHDQEDLAQDSGASPHNSDVQAHDRDPVLSRSDLDHGNQRSRIGTLWATVGTSLAVMVILIVFILQNQDYVQVRFFGLSGSVPAGVALVIGAVGGGILVGTAGAARILQLRLSARRRRRSL